jgi:Asp-tRNA(Asn)/Glu-tRNA(Gln) amidotransferase A subunit family amidase
MGEPGELPVVGPEEIWMWSAFAGMVPLTATSEFREFCARHVSLLAPHSQLSFSAPARTADPDGDRRQSDLIGTMSRVFERHDVVCSPTMSVVAPVAPQGWATAYEDPYMGTNFTFLANTTGCPAASVPCGFTGGLPVGMQVIGRPGDEATVLRVCQALEARRPLLSRPPDIW